MRRSRYGCRNCKLRKVKCDEAKPQCKRCGLFGVLCNYLPDITDLQPIVRESARRLVGREPIVFSSLTGTVWASDESVTYHLDAKCQNFVTKYLGRSITAPHDPNMENVNRELLRLAFTHPFLMHASLAVAFAYDRHLNSDAENYYTPEECYHWYRSTALFNRRLKDPIEMKDLDTIWGTAGFLTISAFAFTSSNRPEESWPLKSSDSGLEWLQMSKGKMSLWDMTDPLRPDSVFRVMAGTLAQMNSPLPEGGLDRIPKALAIVCHIRHSSTAQNNPYLSTAHAISWLQAIPDDQVTVGQTEPFVRTIQGPFETLVRQKNPVALLLLYLWYRKASRSIWWIELRARMECPSICSYLHMYHSDNDAIQAFLPGGHLANCWSDPE